MLLTGWHVTSKVSKTDGVPGTKAGRYHRSHQALLPVPGLCICSVLLTVVLFCFLPRGVILLLLYFTISFSGFFFRLSSNIIYPRAAMSFPEWLTSPFCVPETHRSSLLQNSKGRAVNITNMSVSPIWQNLRWGPWEHAWHRNRWQTEQLASWLAPSPSACWFELLFHFGKQGQVYSHDLGKARSQVHRLGLFIFPADAAAISQDSHLEVRAETENPCLFRILYVSSPVRGRTCFSGRWI